MISRIFIFLISILLFGCISQQKPSALNGGVLLTIKTKSNQENNSNSKILFFQKSSETEVITIEDFQLKNKFKIEFEKRGFIFDNKLTTNSLIVSLNKNRMSFPINLDSGRSLISNGVGYHISIYKSKDKNAVEIFNGTATILSIKANIESLYESKLIESLVLKYGSQDFSITKWIDDVKTVDEIIK